jgi:hypothetical protein
MRKPTQDEPQLGHGGVVAGFEMRVFEAGGRPPSRKLPSASATTADKTPRH